jgi:hypothetical protein
MSCGNSRNSKCNPCGPSEAAMNEIANRAAYYARMAQYTSDGFNQVYLGAKDVAPTTDNNGDPIIEGALYFNTTDNLIYTWDGTIWSAILVGTNTNQTITGQKTFTQNILANGGVTGSVTGNSTTATTLQTPRTIAISGSVTGTATSFDGSANISIPATITTGATIASPNLAGTATGALTSKVVQGVTDVTSATAGFLGEEYTATQGPTSIASGDIETGATLNLSAGVWEVFGQAIFNFTSVTTSAIQPIVASIQFGGTNTINYGNCNQVLIPIISTGLTLSPAYSLVPLSYRFQTVVPTILVYITVGSPASFSGTMTFETKMRAIRVR